MEPLTIAGDGDPSTVGHPKFRHLFSAYETVPFRGLCTQAKHHLTNRPGRGWGRDSGEYRWNDKSIETRAWQ